jgi:hypothetical protein
MKKVLSILTMFVFVAGFAMAQNPPAKKTEKTEPKKEVKAEGKTKADTTKKAPVKHKGGKKAPVKTTGETKK